MRRPSVPESHSVEDISRLGQEYQCTSKYAVCSNFENVEINIKKTFEKKRISMYLEVSPLRFINYSKSGGNIIYSERGNLSRKAFWYLFSQFLSCTIHEKILCTCCCYCCWRWFMFFFCSFFSRRVFWYLLLQFKGAAYLIKP